MEPPWDQVYARDVPPDFDEMRKREDRKERIKPYWDLLVNDKEPKVNKDALVRLMHDLKEEGNALFKDSHFDIAWMHYRNAIFVVRILENSFFHTVENEFTSSLFSNRAFCCLKKSMYKEAVQDCESAIGVFPKNIKAYYRQAQAYKNMKKFSEAYRSACKGQEMQPSSEALKELIDELEPKITVGSRSGDQQTKQTAEVSAKSGQILNTGDKKSGVDNEWLTGTNITVTQKQLETRSKMAKKGRKKGKGGAKSVVVSSSIEPESESDDPSPAEYEDDTEFANMLIGVQQNTATKKVETINGRGMSGGGLDIIAPPTEEEETPWSSFPHDLEEDQYKNDVYEKQAAMGLDNFSTPEIIDSEGGSFSYSNTSSGRSSRASQSPAKFITVPSRTSSLTPSPGPTTIPQITFPLEDEYDFKIACRHCFSKIGEGIKGYRYVNAAHQCIRDVLILKKKNTQGLSWLKVRPRPEAKGHYGIYKICTQFSQNKPCKVAEEKCTFPHHQAEANMWTIDRDDGNFTIENFVAQCKTYKLYDSDALNSQKSKQQYIPGLNYGGGNKKKPTLELMDSVQENQNTPAQSSYPGKSASSQIIRPNIPQSIPQNRFSVPQNDYFSHPPPASMLTYPPPSPGMPHYPGPPGYPQRFNGYNYGQFSQPPPPVPNQRSQWSLQTPTVIEDQEQGYDLQQPVAKLDNPLADTHNAFVVCQHCFKATMYPGIYEFINITHKCEETMLALRRKSPGEPYVRVRERKNHREFPGNYILCNSIRYKNPSFCKYGEELCSFAHNDVERFFWTLEKDGKFNITEFLIQNRKFAVGKGFSLQEILNKHGGYFEFICRACYYGTPPKISLISSDPTKCNGDPPGHIWKDFKILAHVGPGGVFTLINPRGFLHKSAFFKICKWLQFCRSRVNATCRFAHSMIERDIWMLERDCEIKRSEIASQSKMIVQGPPTPSSGYSSGQSTVVKSSPTPSVTSTYVPEQKQQQAAIQNAESQGVPAASDGLCPITVLEVCETCWKRGQRTQQQAGKDRCQKGHGNWSCNIVYLLSPSLKELRPLPRKIPSGLNFIVCQYVKEGKKCGFTGRGPCQFAHCVEEMEAWKFMCANNLSTPAELSQASKAAQKARAETAKNKISGQSVVSVSMNPVSASRPAMPVTSVHTFYCHYCGVSCNSQKQWDEHCASEKHNFNVNSDKEHQWNYRQPPWTSGRFYELCEKHDDGGQCQYSNVPDMYNLCRYAHSQDELDEWKERYEWRQMKREMARQEKVFSYMDELLEKYENSTDPVNVITENLDGVDIKTTGELHIYREEKQTRYTWIFEIASLKSLERVALLYNRDRLHFSLTNSTERSCQIAQGDVFCHNVSHQGKPLYEIQLNFIGGMFGSFMQWILFDFGPKYPVVCRKVTVEIGNQSSHEKVKNLRQQLQFDRWTSLNRGIVRHEIMEEIEEMLIRKYKESSSSETVVTQTTVTQELNRHNYKAKMQKLLELEEMTRHQIISSYNLCVTIECLQAIEEATYVFAMAGELFARVPLQENLTEDTDAGKLILTSVRKVLLAPRSDSEKVVFEASIVNKENFEFDGRGRDFIYLCLSPQCVKQLGLKPGTSVDVEIQFQMDRLFFCRMHYALDQLHSSEIVFPDVPKINPLRNEKHNLRISSSVLNPDQMSAVRHIVAERTGYTPPFVLFGPFGTGKTETIAQATMVLLKETKETRILICAQSNSAADLYIVKHFDTFLKRSGNQALVKRVYFKDRLLYTVSPQVKNYCLLSPEGDAFLMPSRDDIEKCRVVIVTVTTSLVLANLGLQGMFTHIFIDEAAQTLECESLMPLTLATEKTCIVLAGDHRQISPKVYSMEARNQNLHQSLLERLHQYYDSHSTYIPETSPLNILLSINYRTKMEILRFISSVFYGGPDVLKSEANIRSVLSITPLAFYAVQGREVQDENSISYYNMSEVQEVVDRVDDLFDKWPEEWGSPSAKEIGVVTPYYDQVILIRKALKKRNIALKDVIVERVQGVQGKEFRAMFITTVRTRHLIEAPHVQSQALTECDGEGGDFGFLSDSKLLNTALTRAQSLVVVVGDPVALCAVGECVNVWRTYIKHCQNMSSLYPQNHTFDSIKQQVQNLLNSPARERLLQIANERQSGQKLASLVQSTRNNMESALHGSSSNGQLVIDSGMNNDDLIGSGVGSNQAIDTSKEADLLMIKSNGTSNSTVTKSPLTPLNPLRSVITRGLPPAPLSTLTKRISLESYYEVGDEFTLDPDDILFQLIKLDGNVGSNGGNGNMTKDSVTVREESGQAVVRGGSNTLTENGAIYPSYDDKQLRTLLTNELRYLKTQLHIDSNGCKAEVLDGPNKGIKVDIPSRWMCGQGNDNDEAVIEIVKDGGQTYGKVVGVLKSAVNLKDRYIVCTVGDNGGIMVPINNGLSPMFNVVTTPSKHNKDDSVVVYRLTKNKQVRISHIEKFNIFNRTEKMFITRFLKWDSKLQLPLCIVLGVYNVGNDLATCMNVLELEHHLVKAYNPGIAEEVDYLYPDNFKFTDSMLNSRTLDLRECWCFTIDSSSTSPTSKAFSIDEIGDGNYQVGVHFSDVAAFVNKGSSVDIEAQSRGVACFSSEEEPVHMLPNRLCTDLCNFKSGEDKLAFSVLMTVQPTGEVIQVNIQKTIINCKKSFNLREAQDIIQDPTAHEDYLKSCVLVLFEIARLWRKERLGNASLYHDNILEKPTSFACQLVEEMIVMTEFHIAKIVLRSFPDTLPLFVQDAPDKQALGRWRQEHAADAVNSIALTKPFLNSTVMETCKCGLACTHTVNFVRHANIVKREQINVVSTLWDSLNDAVGLGDFGTIQDIIVSPENHPQLTVALYILQSIQKAEKFICSTDVKGEDYHYTLNRKPYTKITQPLSCYVDIVVQRLLSACLDGKACPYTQSEIQVICNDVTKSFSNRKKFEEEARLLHLSSALLSRPLLLYTVIVQSNLEKIEICFSNLLSVIKLQTIDLVSLGICEPPSYSENGGVILKWRERVYDYSVLQNVTVTGSNYGELNPDRFIYNIPAFQWQRLLIAIREQDEGMRVQKLTSAVEIVRKQVSNPALVGNYIEDVTSEVHKLGNIKHLTEFSLQLSLNQILLVQLSASSGDTNPLLSPYIQLFNLTNHLDICLQHAQHPDTCFTNKHNIIEPSQANCMDISSYQKVWMPILELEAASKAVESNDRILINNVPIEWTQDGLPNTMIGFISLPLSFIKQRQIKMSSNFEQKMLFNPDNSSYCNAYFSDFVCIRYSNVTLPNKAGLNEDIAQLVNTGGIFTWVGHCTIIDVAVVKDTIRLKLQLVQSDVPLPVIVRRRPCSVELIMRTESDRMMMYSLRSLEYSSKLAQDIVMRQTPTNTLQLTDVESLLQSCRGILHVPNQQQEAALKMSLEQPLTVIQGCVGSGKSVLAAKLGFMYIQRNRVNGGPKRQVLLCAPRETCLDILTSYFMSLKTNCPRVVRVYSDSVERLVHPSPKYVTRNTPYNTEYLQQIKANYSVLSLYNLIRSANSPVSKPLTEFESLFSMYPDDISEDQFDEFLELQAKAEAAVLMEADIILCTTLTAGLPKIKSNTNIQQIIIDDANSGSELELLVPLSVYKEASQVTVIGDVNQIGPHVTNEAARMLGLGRSFMNDNLSLAVYLNVQYRVHEGIVDFPSKNSYEGRILCGTMNQRQPSILNWPAGRTKPVAFCKLKGTERTHVVDLGLENEHSICNTDQADFTVRITVALVTSYQVPAINVAVICTTRAQCMMITHKLSSVGNNSSCLTIEESQGKEFDYVILNTVRTVDNPSIERYPDRKWKLAKLGQLVDKAIVTTALTRAKKGLVIVGNDELLRCDALWAKLLADYGNTGRIVTSDAFLKSMSM